MIRVATPDLSCRHLLALLAIHGEGSYRAAGARLGYSQSAVTGQVAALEKALGVPVFDRLGGPRGVTLTPAGRLALLAARDVLARLDLLASGLHALGEGRGGRLAIGTFQSVSARLLPPVLRELRSDEPDVEVEVLESDDNDELVAGLRSGRLDVSFLVGPVASEGLEVHEVVRDPFVAVYSADADDVPDALLIGDVAGLPLIGHRDCGCHELLERGLRDAGVRASYAFRSNDNVAVQAMVRAGIGVAVMPLLAVDATDAQVRVVPLAPPLAGRPIMVATPSGRTTPTASRFVTRILDAARTLDAVP